ncbi:MAG: hypothetical protein J7574_22700 [Flavobacterium sp.]|uniref:hypothetical protein n=1 Tax=Flavobacterium sp. TaxID=239 RepID=UPI001B1EF118|nr:hypothetical protein [Flavobacterium sp.]MBO9586980.1 hypothetical protein [Flavobacterium sp.]
MKGLVTYSEWINLLNKFGDGNDSVLEELNLGTFIIDAGTANRFYTKVEEIYKKRKQTWLDKFQRFFDLQSIKTEDDFEIALRNGKQNLLVLKNFISLKGFPEDLKKTLKEDLESFITEIRTSLKANNKKSSGRNEKIAILLNSFQLTSSFEEETNSKVFPKDNTIIAPTSRKIIF